MPLVKHPLPYFHDSALLFERIKHMHWPMFLDSGQMMNEETGEPASQFGRYDILVANPVKTLVTHGAQTKVTEGSKTNTSKENPFNLLNDILAPYIDQTERNDLPFSGGALGYFSYDLGRSLETLPSIAEDDMNTPEMMVGIYDWAIVVDHREETASLVSHQHFISDAQWSALVMHFEDTPSLTPSHFSVESEIVSNFNDETYEAAFNQVADYIKAGDCYQVNLAQRLSAEVEGDSWAFYEKLRTVSPAPFMAYMQLEHEGEAFEILSVSPERFLHVIDDTVETRPIKGTRPRYDHPDDDLKSAIDLVTSFKDRAENVMIVDLLRNDIGKSCEIGSIKVAKLFNLESFANVHHLVSYVTGQLRPDQSAVNLLEKCFPGGSITGAPKLRAMEIIEALEPHRRGVYCGAIGYIGFNGDMDTSITIRTAVVKQNKIYFHAGGGVVADSIVDKEYKETLDKASNFLTTIKYFMRN